MKDLKKDSILKALDLIDENPEIRNGRKSSTYDLVYEGKTYPPILVLSEANKLEGGDSLTLKDFNNNTNDAFNILEDLGFKVEEKGDSLKSILAIIGSENARKFFDFIEALIEKLEVDKGDERVVFSLRPDQNRLIFTIGQRYCLVIEVKAKTEWGFITSDEKENLESSSFDGAVTAFWNKTKSFEEVEKSFDEILSACQRELNRTNKSSFKKFNNQEFEKAIFDKNFRMNLFEKTSKQERDSETFLDTLNQFLEQAKTDDLSYSHYTSKYNDLKVRVSFGKGNKARIPWISFLHESQSTNEGIYPVYLLFKERNILVLAYGVSEENEPHHKWPLENPVTIKSYFQENNLGKPQRYGASYVFKVYDLDNSLEGYSIDSDLYELTNFYKIILESNEVRSIESKFDINALSADLNNSNLIYNSNLVQRFVSGILAKPFLILTGLSGSGKTKLAQAFAKWIIEDDEQLNLVPVGADWTNREPLLGYPDAIREKEYVLPESGVLQLMLYAKEDPERPYFLILDEMNLSHVERYFADFLSAIESNEEIKLHSGDDGDLWDGVPPTIKEIPKNLFIIGTVNIDETTYMFSPKVLDRANVIEFRVSKKEMKSFLEAPADVDLSELKGRGAGMSKDFVRIATKSAAEFSDKSKLSDELIQFFENLSDVGAEFGYRTANEINRFASLAEQLAEDWEFDNIMDAAIAQKLLPKLHGSRRKLEGVLFKLGQLCINEGDAEELIKKPGSIDWDENVKYPISLEKIVRMHKGLLENGFTSFAEA